MLKKMSFLAVFFVSVLFVFTGCNNNKKEAGVSDEEISVQKQKSEFCVLTFSPEGELPATVRFPQIQIQFSKPVVALKELGKVTEKSDLIKIEPALPGKFRWLGTSLLSFESKNAVIPQKEYTVTVSSKLTSVTGEKISGNLSYKFHSEQLNLVSVVAGYEAIEKGEIVDQNDVPVDLAKKFRIFFNSPVNAKYMEKQLLISSSSGRNLNFTAEAAKDNAINITLKEMPETNETILICLPKGASSDEGCYPVESNQVLQFCTLRAFTVNEVEFENVYCSSSYKNPVEFRLQHMLVPGSEAEVAKHVKTEPEMEITEKNIAINGKVLYVHSLPVTFDSEYKIILDENLSDIYGERLGKEFSCDVKVPSAASYAYYKDYGFKMLESQFDPKLAFSYQNIIKENSYYLIHPMTNATGGKPNTYGKTIQFSERVIPENQQIIEGVDLRPYLDKKDNGYRGSILFNAEIGYSYNYTDWATGHKTLKTAVAKNAQYIQVTDLGCTARVGYNKAVVLVTNLSTGKPVSNAEVLIRSIPNKEEKEDIIRGAHLTLGKATTDLNGFAKVYFPKKTIRRLRNNNTRNNIYIEVKTSDDRIIFNPDINNMYRTNAYCVKWPWDAEAESQKTFIFTDRGLYKPGEKVTFRGIDRTLCAGEYSPYNGFYTIEIKERKYKAKPIISLKGKVSDAGSFWNSFELPEDLTPGSYEINYLRNGDYFTQKCFFEVQFFERLRFEAKTTIPSLTYYSGDKIDAEFSAQYLGGGSLGGCKYDSSWSREPIGFAPKGNNLDGYRFGPLQGYDGRTSLDSESGVLSGAGKATSSLQTGSEKLKGMAYSYRVEAQITDSGNQMISTNKNVLVHPAKFYIGVSKIKNTKGFPKKGNTLMFDYRCVTPEGEVPLAKDLPDEKKRNLKIELMREEWKQVQQIGWNGQINTRYVREMITEEEKVVSLNAGVNASEISVVPPKGGAYLLRLSTVDAKECEVITETRFYVVSSDWYWFNRNNADEITMLTDKELYEVGDTASILVQSPLPAGTYMMTIEREGIIDEKLLHFDEPTTIIEVPVEDSYVPVMYVTLSSYSVRNGPPQNTYDTPDLDKPKGYFGLAVINVSTSSRQFDIEIIADKKTYRPGDEATIKLHASHKGVPVENAEITLMAVDRGVIDLINYHVPDPVKFFYDKYNFALHVIGGDSRSLLMDPVTYEIRNLFGGDSADDSSKIEERKNFDPTAVFVPYLITDANGDVSYTFTLPDTLTSYRVTAVGVDKNNFAKNENEIPVANPVSVREVLPRKLRVSDLSEAGVTITNLTEEAKDVTVTIEVTDGVKEDKETLEEGELAKLPGNCLVSGEVTKSITVGANSTEPLMFRINANKEGWVTVVFTVESDVVNERIIKTLEIDRPYIYETVTTIGQVTSEEKDGSASFEEKIIIPESADNGKGNIYIQLDATKLGMLHEAVNYVFKYPYGCMEQRSAKVLPLIAFSEYIHAFGLENEVLFPKAVAKKEIHSWKNVQKEDGGFPYWQDGNRSDPYVSIRIGEIIALEQEKGIENISNNPINVQKLCYYIQSQKNENINRTKDSSWRCYFTAYANYVLQRLGTDVPSAEIEEIVENEKSDLNALSLCALTYLEKGEKGKAKSVARKIRNYTKYSTRGISLTSTQGKFNYWSYFNDQSEDLALLLTVFSKLDPKDEINARLVYELLMLENNSNGYWKSTAVTARVLCALDVYIRANDLTNTNLTASALLGGKKFVDGKFKGVNAVPVDKTVEFNEDPLNSLPRDKELPLVFNKEGEGTLFYTVSMKYAIPASKQYADEQGICVYTEITDVKTGEVVEEDKLEAGKVYREKIYLSTNLNRQYVALRAPIPSGAEIMNAAFVTTGTFPKEETKRNASLTVDVYSEDGWDSSYYWYEPYNYGLSSQAIYDNEIQYFWNYFPQGNQQVEFLFRAVRTGIFETPCATAECMYEPEVFGRTAGKCWTIE